MIEVIINTIYDDKLKIYKQCRKDFEYKLGELDKKRQKMLRWKKNKKEKQKTLQKLTVEKF